MTSVKRLALTCCLLGALSTTASAAVTYLQNFDSGIDGWEAKQADAASTWATLTITASGQSGNGLQVADSGYTAGIRKLVTGVVEGEDYNFTFWVKVPSDFSTAKAFVRQETAGSVLVGSIQFSPEITRDNTWREVTLTGTIAATATQVRIGINTSHGLASHTYFIDTVSFTSVDPSAAIRTWDGGGADDNFTTGLNWGGTAPVAGDEIVFDGVTRLSPNLDASLSVTKVSFAAGAGAFSITRPGTEVLTTTGDIVNSSGNLQTIGAAVTISGSGRIINTGTGGISNTAGTVSASGFTKTGTGTLTLSGGTTPNLAGTVAVSAGTLALGSSEQIANSAVVDVAANAVFDLDGNTETIGQFAASTSAGETRLGAGQLTITTSASGAGSFYGGDIKGDAGSKFIKAGTGEIRLHKSTMVNTFEKLEIQSGMFRLGQGDQPNGTDAMLGAIPGAFLQDQITISGGTLGFNGNSAATRINVNANRGITISGTATIDTLVDTLIPGNITGSGLLLKTGGRDLELTGLNDFSGGLTLAGPVTVSSQDNVGTGPIKLNTGGNLIVTANGIDITNKIDLSAPLVSTFGGSANYTLSGDVDLGGGSVGTRVTIPSATVTMSGSLTNTLGLVKDGAGTLILSGNSTFSGTTVISNGVLHYASTGVTSAGSLIVKNGGTLSGTGTVGGEVTVESGGTVSAGASPGTLNTGNLVWNGGGINKVEVNDATGTAGADPGWDLINVTGTLTINATIGNKFTIDAVSLTSGNVPGSAENFNGASDYSWVIVTTSGGISGFDPAAFNIPINNFSDIPEGGGFTLAVVGNDLVLKYSLSNPPLITAQPVASQTVASGTQVILSATVTGTEPLVYRWEKDSVVVSDGGDISGAETATLTLDNTVPGSSGSYVLIVTNEAGSATSDVAVVTVIDAPVITGQPSGATISEGANFNPTATVTGGGTLVYQWKKDNVDLSNGGNVSGAKTDSLSITSVTVEQAGIYTLAVSNEVGNDTSSGAVLVVQAAPVITVQPQGVSVTSGATAEFSVTATGSDLEYQWKRNGVDIGGATESSYSVVASASTIGSYTVVVFNNLGTAPSDSASLTINKIPVLFEPFNYADTAALNVNWGSNSGVSLVTTNGLPANSGGHNGSAQAHTWIGSSLSITPTDENPVVLRADVWYSGNNNQRNSVGFRTGANPLFEMGFHNSGANGLGYRVVSFAGNESWIELASYTTLGTGSGNARWIRLKATFTTSAVTVTYDLDANGTIDGTSTSTGAHAAKTFTDLRFGGPSGVSSTGGGFQVDNIEISTPAPVISITAQPENISTNAGATAEFSVTAPGATVYQWKKDGADISGATDSTLTLNNVLKADEGSYSVYIENGYDFTTSDAATLTVVDPVILTQPVGDIVAVGANVTFEVVAAGSGTLTYQWKLDGGDISGATDSSYNVSSVSYGDEGSYTVVVTGDEGSIESDPAVLDVQDGPSIAGHPVSQSVNQGFPVAFTVEAGGDAPFTYQWYLDGNEIVGATASNYSIASAQPADGGNYTVEVSNLVGGPIVGGPATLTVIADITSPVLKVLAPGANKIYTDAELLVFGTALDTVGIDAVEYALSDSSGPTASGTATLFYVASGKASNWNTIVNLTPGTNYLTVTAKDFAGNEHSLSMQFFYHTASLLTIEKTLDGGAIGTNNVGEVIAAFPTTLTSGGPLNLFVGRTYTIKAKESGIPAGKYILTNWTATWQGQTEPVELAGNVLAAGFTMQSNMVLKANFISNPFYALGGIYNGLFSQTGNNVEFANSGYITMKVSPKQTFSAKAIVDGNVVTLAGKFNIDGTGGTGVSKTRVKIADKPELSIDLAMDFAGASGTVSGTISQTGENPWTSDLLAHRVVWATNNVANAYTNTYTMLVSGYTNLLEGPAGTSSAVITVDPLGKVKMLGIAGDGNVAKHGTYVSQSGLIPFYSSLYVELRTNESLKVIKETQGLMMGWLQLTNGGGNMKPEGEVHWIKTGWTNEAYVGGFTNVAEVAGSRWLHDPLAPANTLTNMPYAEVAVIYGGEIGDSFKHVWQQVPEKATLAVFKFDKPDVYVYENAHKAALVSKTGVFKGTFIHPVSTEVIKYLGVVLQDENYGEGSFVGPNTTGKVTLDAVQDAPTP